MKVIEDDKITNIFIDSGFKGTYIRGVKPEIKKISDNNGEIDIFIITHVDQDHIGGLLNFIENDNEKFDKIVKEVWFNCYTNDTFLDFSEKISFSQGLKLKDYLIKNDKFNDKLYFFNKKNIERNNISFLILSPNREILKNFLLGMKKEEEVSKKIASKNNDYSCDIEELYNETFKENLTIENLSSLAFIISINNRNFLFSGDASAKIMYSSLKDLGYSKDNKLKLDYFKLPHHGSENNLSKELLEIIECYSFIISTNGDHNNNPTKMALSRILLNKERNIEKTISFIFNYNNEVLKGIFSEEEKKKYNFKCLFPEGGEHAYTITIK
ncbi:MAG: MBL fold metallo-hydrolase [Fusobacterium sp. JB019]|nr:MBL fold metallo-hydrolase [Fusobacterium sp. JB019]